MPDATPWSVDRCVYGPVPSRRLGRSLGVDVVPFKACTYDCVYCQLGRTTQKRVRRRRWMEPSPVIDRVRARLASRPDVIALAGSGEPTLYQGLGELIRGIKESTSIPVAVITNGSLLGVPAVARDVLAADMVLPSLDAPDEGLFRRVNRPHHSLRFQAVVDGIAEFRRRYDGRMWLEVMLLNGVTDGETERLASLAARIGPDRVQLNTVVRPAPGGGAHAVAPERLRRFVAVFGPSAEVIAPMPEGSGGGEVSATQVVALLQRRPCTVTDIASGLGIHHAEALKTVTSLTSAGQVRSRDHGGQTFYTAANDSFQEER